MTGFKEKFQEKKKFPKLPRRKYEDFEANPWGGVITSAILRIVNERREKERAEKKSFRKSSYQDVES